MQITNVGVRTASLLCLILTGLSACAERPKNILLAAGPQTEGTNRVAMLVATTRQRSAIPGEMFSGERGSSLAFADIAVSIPPDRNRTPGEVQWPSRMPGDPSRDFVTIKADAIDSVQAAQWMKHRSGKGKKHILLFVHGFNNRFEEAVYRFAQIEHDSGAPTVPVLFTWPSRGSVLDYGYDRESTNYSRDALEKLLRMLAKEASVGEISILAHSMGNWVTLESLRQMAIRSGGVDPKIRNVMLAAPDVDVDVFRSQISEMGKAPPQFTLFVSRDDRALAVSRRVWGDVDRLGAIDATQKRYADEFEKYRINVVDLTGVSGTTPLNHAKFAGSEVVHLIGNRLASGQQMNDSKVAIGDHITNLTIGGATAAGSAAALVISAPVAVIDPGTRDNYGKRVGQLGNIITDAATGSPR